MSYEIKNYSQVREEKKKKKYSYKELFSDIRDSISGEEKDFTSGSVGKAILLLSIPVILEMIAESIFAIVDIFFVSRINEDAVAAVGITESLMTLVYAIGMGLSMATTAVVSRRIGEKNPEGAANAAFQAILTGIGGSLIFAIPGIFYAGDILSLMGASEIIVGQMSSYTAIMISGNFVIMLLFIINAIFRSAGDAAISMKILWFANIINLILDPLLIFGAGPIPAMGIMGAAIATNIGRGLAVLLQFYILFRGVSKIKFTLKALKPDIKVIKKIIKLSGGTIGQFIIGTSSWILLTRILTEFGSHVVAGYTVAIRIMIFFLLPSWGVSNAAATLVGQNLGANQPDRAERSVWIISKVNMFLLGIIGIILIVFAEEFISLFPVDAVAFEIGANSLRVLSYGFLGYGVGMVLINAFNGAGDTYTPTIINVCCFWLFEIPLAYALATQLGYGPDGVFWSIVIAESMITVAAYFIFRRGKWKHKTI